MANILIDITQTIDDCEKLYSKAIFKHKQVIALLSDVDRGKLIQKEKDIIKRYLSKLDKAYEEIEEVFHVTK